MYKLAAIVILLLLGPVFNAKAGYENTSWGMSLKKIKKLYPGGHAQELQNGRTRYAVVRPVASLDTGLLMFTFSEKSRLSEVMILFPEPGTKVDLKSTNYTPTDNEKSQAIFQSLKSALILKYGNPDPLSTGTTTIWETHDEDAITLSILPNTNNPGTSTAAIMYVKVPAIKDMSKGL